MAGGAPARPVVIGRVAAAPGGESENVLLVRSCPFFFFLSVLLVRSADPLGAKGALVATLLR